jgi:hypothetical protein
MRGVADESGRQVADSAAAVVVFVLLAEQLLTGAIGVWGGLRLSDAPTLLHAQIVGLVVLDGLGLMLLLRRAGWRPRVSRIFVVCVAALCVAAIVKNLDVSPVSATIDVVRLLVPLLWVALIPMSNFAQSFFDQVRRRRLLVIAILSAQVIGLVAGRFLGWDRAYLSGDPITPALIVPTVLSGGAIAGPAVTVLLAAVLLVGSLKRTAWLSAVVAIVLLAAGSARFMSLRSLIRAAIVVVLVIATMFAAIRIVGFGDRLSLRATSIAVSLSRPDDSVGQRLEEIAVESARVKSQPVQSLFVGVSSEDFLLSNGQFTHAIHNTPLFLLFGGGLIWLLALLGAGRTPPGPRSEQDWLLTLIVVWTLLDSLGENMALAPSFGLALAAAHAQVRRLVAAWRARS